VLATGQVVGSLVLLFSSKCVKENKNPAATHQPAAILCEQLYNLLPVFIGRFAHNS